MTLFDTARIGSGVPVGEPPAGPAIVGLDLSLTATGVAGNAGGGWAEVIKPPAKLRGHERMNFMLAEIGVRYRGVDLVVVEGPSYGSQSGQSGHHERAGLWWLVTHSLWIAGTPTAVVPPASLKKYLTGKGNASKDAMLVAATRRFDWCPADNNAGDAAGLVAAAADHYGVPLATMPAAHRAALTAVEWPVLVVSDISGDGATC